jgi:eukaryotic-like serine/threonine-protein kinase
MLTALLILTSAFVILGGELASGQAADDWPMFRQNPQHTGFSTSSSPETDTVLWTYETDYEIDSSPAIANGHIIVGVSNGDILALEWKTGKEIWKHSLETGTNSIWSSPAINSERIYIGSRDNNLYCLDEKNGNLIWSFPTGGDIDSSPVIVEERVFFSSNDGYLYSVNAVSGDLIWKIPINLTGTDEFSSPAVNGDVVYAASSAGKFYAVSTSTGDTLWTFGAGSSSAPVFSEGKVFLVSDSTVYCLDADNGGSIWSAPLNFPNFRSAPALSNGRLFVATGFGRLYSFDASNGSKVWSYDIGDEVWSSPSVADGKVFIGSGAGNGRVYSFNENTGSPIWNHSTIERSIGGPVFSNGIVIVGCGGSNRGGIFAFGALPKATGENSLDLILIAAPIIVVAVAAYLFWLWRRKGKQTRLMDFQKAK